MVLDGYAEWRIILALMISEALDKLSPDAFAAILGGFVGGIVGGMLSVIAAFGAQYL